MSFQIKKAPPKKCLSGFSFAEPILQVVDQSESASRIKSAINVLGKSDSIAKTESEIDCEVTDFLPCPVIGNSTCTTNCNCNAVCITKEAV